MTTESRLKALEAWRLTAERRLMALEAPPSSLPPVPVTTLQGMVDATPTGGLLTVPAGTYAPIKVNRSMVIRGQGQVIIQGGDIGVLLAASGIALETLTVTGATFCGIYGNAPIVNPHIIGCYIHDCGDFGIHLQGGPKDVLIVDCIAHGFAGRQYPPHAFYLKGAVGAVIRRCEGAGPLGAHPNGYSGFEATDCSGVLAEDCWMHDCRGAGANDGYGYIADNTTSIVYRRCRGSFNYFDYYECALTGSAVYEECVGTKRVWP
jgi:hypothetical protein